MMKAAAGLIPGRPGSASLSISVYGAPSSALGGDTENHMQRIAASLNEQIEIIGKVLAFVDQHSGKPLWEDEEGELKLLHDRAAAIGLRLPTCRNDATAERLGRLSPFEIPVVSGRWGHDLTLLAADIWRRDMRAWIFSLKQAMADCADSPQLEPFKAPATATFATSDVSEALAAVLDPMAVQIANIGGDKSKSADVRMGQIYCLDNRAAGWDSTVWAKVLGVSSNRVRQTEWWNHDRPRLRG